MSSGPCSPSAGRRQTSSVPRRSAPRAPRAPPVASHPRKPPPPPPHGLHTLHPSPSARRRAHDQHRRTHERNSRSASCSPPSRSITPSPRLINDSPLLDIAASVHVRETLTCAPERPPDHRLVDLFRLRHPPRPTARHACRPYRAHHLKPVAPQRREVPLRAGLRPHHRVHRGCERRRASRPVESRSSSVTASSRIASLAMPIHRARCRRRAARRVAERTRAAIPLDSMCSHTLV